MSKFLFLASLCITINWSCSSGKEKEPALPAAPASVKAVQDEIKGKIYQAKKAGTHSLISTDKEITWLEPTEKEKMEKEVADESKSIRMNFTNDTSVIVSIKGKTHTGTYSVGNETKEDEKEGIKIRVSYVDEEFKFGDGPAMKVTYLYLVEGINNKSILLETPRSLNQRKIVILMNKE